MHNPFNVVALYAKIIQSVVQTRQRQKTSNVSPYFGQTEAVEVTIDI